MINPMDLTGKRILVVGATGGIGAETAVQLSKLGANIIVCGRSKAKLQDVYKKLEGDGHAQYIIDLKDVDSIEGIVKRMVTECGAFSGVAFCSGIGEMRPLNLLKRKNMIEAMDINLFSFVEIVRCITKKGCFTDKGSIVAVSSIASTVGKASKIAYSASKAALDGAIRCMVCDLKKKKIRINSVMPSWVNTNNMYTWYIEHYPDTFEVKEIEEKQYLGVTEPIEVANTIAFLLSDAAVTITGASILIDGGMSQG